MCSIVGMVGQVAKGRWGVAHAVLTELLRVSECRGTDATGFAAVTRPLAPPRISRVITDREAVRAAQFVQQSSWKNLRRHRSIAVIGHTRLATTGNPTLRLNAHPFAAGPYHLVHNGVLANHTAIAREFGLRLRSQTDSEVLLRLIEAMDDPLDGLNVCLRRVVGTMAIALLDADRQAVWLARRGRPLWLCRFGQERVWWFGSTAEIMFSAFDSVLGKRARSRITYLSPIPETVPIAILPNGTLYTHDGGSRIH